jgi:hypothetical protein
LEEHVTFRFAHYLFPAGFFLGLFFVPNGGGNMFFQNFNEVHAITSQKTEFMLFMVLQMFKRNVQYLSFFFLQGKET